MARDRSPERDKARQIWLDSGGTMTAREVAEKVGYKDQFYFSRIFRSYMGVCPSDYLEGAKY